MTHPGEQELVVCEHKCGKRWWGTLRAGPPPFCFKCNQDAPSESWERIPVTPTAAIEERHGAVVEALETIEAATRTGSMQYIRDVANEALASLDKQA